MAKNPLTLRLFDSTSEVSVDRNFLRNYRVEVATRKVIEDLLGGRNNIRVKILVVPSDGSETMNYLFGLSNMKVSVLLNFEIGLPRCYPLIQNSLKSLYFEVSHPTDFEHPIVRTAEKIGISSYGYDRPEIWFETHKDLPNKEVAIDTIIDWLTDISILDLIEYWKETHRFIGSAFRILKPRTYVTLTEIDESEVAKINAISVKVDSESEIVVYESEDLFGRAASNIVIKVISIGSYTEILQPLDESDNFLRNVLNDLPLVAPVFLAVFITLFVNYLFSAQIDIFTVYVVSFFNPHAFRTENN